MSICVQDNNIHLIGNVQKGIIDEFVITPLISVFSMIEDSKPNVINLHLSGSYTTFNVQIILDLITCSKIPVDIYIENSELFNGYNGIDGNLLDLLSAARNVYDNKDKEYNPPLNNTISEIHMLREQYNYNINRYNDDEEEDDEEYSEDDENLNI
jgi:hypothetical protein